jgi:hypothetical protein
MEITVLHGMAAYCAKRRPCMTVVLTHKLDSNNQCDVERNDRALRKENKTSGTTIKTCCEKI